MNDSIQKELANTLLGKNCCLPKNQHEIESKYYRYIWELKIRHAQIFKERLFRYKEKHPEIDLYSYPINTPLRIAQTVFYIVGTLGAGLAILDFILKISPQIGNYLNSL